jgi:DNA-binding MarR family transcriptional regulator
LTKYDIDKSFGSIVHWAERALIARLNNNFIKAGFYVTREQYRLLVYLWNQEGQTQQELAAATRKDKTTITRIIRGLEKRDLVIRVKDRVDKRINILYLTKKGIEYTNKLTKIAALIIEEALADIPADEIKICKKVLQKATINLIKR